MRKEVELASLEDTKKLAKELVKLAKPGVFFLMSGYLGAGKTTLTKSLLKELGVEESVTSPTFVIMNQYDNGSLNINHMDAYRLTKNDDLYLYLETPEQDFNIIEWYDNVDFDYDNYKNYKINITKTGDTTRLVTIESRD
ncbi:tRNA (adenosine(37)-N6)-threonylcarbamoyltransferase complex ATPase subunit type 1 TsaE [Mesoplasma lactucae]|nr:tRNA (adenosine(37)-N6)-threonylcarbamoyltransferase complex ATPase subunit type 1 TsaE [Mesoplasma lactucae]ATZ19950.1 tRNA (N6-adenosine(37)-N6)-threonylcarbamoyltransferase complex ATPase TsaE [Mesoplasma lactucae ATCC 49193]MCL8217099.1 tRNA threonylcarbamoyladenosine biosynthesis protein TsaE [Mesoplasma lactucae ATCC 49193]